MKYEIDDLDRKILGFLREDSRKPFLEIARELKVSGGTVHARVGRLKEIGVIEGSRVVVNYDKLGYSVSAFVGIKLARAGGFKEVALKLESIPEITELHYTTGSYSLLAKIIVSSVDNLYVLLAEKLQKLDDIQSTETFIVLHTSLNRELELEDKM